MSKDEMLQLFKDRKLYTFKHLSLKYNLPETTIKRYIQNGLEHTLNLKFKDCVMCSKEFYANKRNITCSPECLKEQHNSHNIKSYHKNKHKHYDVRAMNRIKYKVMNRISKVDKEQIRLFKEINNDL